MVARHCAKVVGGDEAVGISVGLCRKFKEQYYSPNYRTITGK